MENRSVEVVTHKLDESKTDQSKAVDTPHIKLSCEKLNINDSSYPSYRNLALPYCVVCRQRYTKAGTKQRLQFLKEIRKQEILQSKALSGIRIHRVFINPIMTPARAEEIIKLTPRQQFKLEQLLKE